MNMDLRLSAKEVDLIILCLNTEASIINRLKRPELGNPYATLAEKISKLHNEVCRSLRTTKKPG